MTLPYIDAELDVQKVEEERRPFNFDKQPVAVVITSYNMPERADALAENLFKSDWPFDLFLVDNGSDIMPPAKWTSVHLDKNIQTTGGWLAGVEASRLTGIDYLGYLFLITSTEFVRGGGDVLASMAQFLVDTPDAVGIHPALTEDSTTAWNHLKRRQRLVWIGSCGGRDPYDMGWRCPSCGHYNCTEYGDYEWEPFRFSCYECKAVFTARDQIEPHPRRTWMIDNICSLYRRTWWDEVGGFDPRFHYGWGIDLELCLLARRQNKSLWVDERVRVKKVTDIAYDLNRMNMSAEERRRKASANMAKVMEMKYGAGWNDIMRNEGVLEEWR